MSDLDNNIYSELYRGLSDVYKFKNNLELYYRYSMQYLAYTPANEVKNS